MPFIKQATVPVAPGHISEAYEDLELVARAERSHVLAPDHSRRRRLVVERQDLELLEMDVVRMSTGTASTMTACA